MNLKWCYYGLFLILLGCKQEPLLKELPPSGPYLTVLGVAQDGGYPHAGYTQEFEAVAIGEQEKALVVSLGLIDPYAQKKYLFEATPDLPEQLATLDSYHLNTTTHIDGIFLTHAHIGHYTGLMYLGREVLGAKDIPVYAMPRMKNFLETNGPWNQLVDLDNIALRTLKADSTISLTTQLKVTPIQVPHRDEFSETVGYRIEGPTKSALFIPDIDKWSKWERDIVSEVQKVDYAFLDATFFAEGEIPRPMSEVPHPFIEETVALFAKADFAIKQKVIFIHFNHSNPALNPESKQRKALETEGFRFANRGDHFIL